jgi:hypothetical protein
VTCLRAVFCPLFAFFAAAALILAICRSEKPPELVEQSRLGVALQRGQTKEIGLTDRTSDAESLLVVGDAL